MSRHDMELWEPSSEMYKVQRGIRGLVWLEGQRLLRRVQGD